jgi:two-component system, cell cycle sensor histidine kinase and response regulator CckA
VRYPVGFVISRRTRYICTPSPFPMATPDMPLSDLLADPARIDALRRSGLLDTPSEEPFEGITSLATRLLDVPVVLITLVDAERQFFKSCPGLPEPWQSRRQTPLSHSFCQHVVRSGEPLVVEDARAHPLVRDNPAIPDMGAIAYAGVPVATCDGHRLGSLAAVDTVPRNWSERDLQTLGHLAKFVAKEVDLRIEARDTARREQEARQELAASADRVSGILEEISDAFVALDREWRYTYVNRKAGQLFGREPESLIGKHIWTEFPDGIGQPFHRAYERAMREQVPITLEEYYEPWSRWFENRIHPSPEGISIFFTEITDRRNAEQALRESEERFRLIAEHIPQVIWLSSGSGEALYISPAFEEIWGLSLDAVMADRMVIRQNIHPDDWERAGPAFAAMAHTRTRVEYRIIRPDGAQRWLSTSGFPIRGQDGDVLYIVGITADVTEQREAEARMRADEERLSLALEGARQGIYDWTVDTGHCYLSPEFERLLGLEPGEIRPHIDTWQENAHPDDFTPAFQTTHYHLEEGGSSITVEYRMRTKQGDWRWFEDRGKVVERHPDGRARRVAGVIQDITEHKQQEFERERLLEAERVARQQLEEQAGELEHALDSLQETNDALTRQKELLQTVFDNVPVMLGFFEADGQVRWVNRTWEEALGWRLEEMRGRDILGEHYPDPAERERVLRQISAGDGTWQDSRTTTRSGEVLETTWADVRLSDGTTIGIGQDITARKETERALAESEQRYRRLFESVGEGYCVIQVRFEGERPVDYRFLEANPAFEQHSGLSDVVGKTANELIPDLEDRWFEMYGRVARTGKPVHFEDGSAAMQRWLDVYAFRVEEPEACKVAVRFTDISERKRTEQALRESEGRYRRFFEDDLTGDYIARVDGTIIECNQAFARIFGFRDVEEAKRIRINTLYPDPRVRDRMLGELRTKGRLEFFETTLQRRDGRSVDVIANLVGGFDEAGELLEIKGYLFDVTERNALEAQLAQSQKMETVGRLAGGIAHDFNNMLTAIIGNTQILLDQAQEDEDLRVGLREIELAAERSAALTRQLLAFSRQQVLQPRPLDLNRTIIGMEGMLRRLIGEHIVVTTRLSAKDSDVYVDPSQMEQVILNLVVNARDAMPRGGELVLQTSVAELDRDAAAHHDPNLRGGHYVALSICDTGHGIDDETRERIFEPFFTTKPVGQGTGLGLSTVYGIVKQSGGMVVVESQIGQGSTFRVLLPLMKRERPRAAEAISDAPVGGGTETILVVEDDHSVRRLVRRVLQGGGYTVIEAASGVQALGLAQQREGSIDLVLSDILMPGMSGQKVVEGLRHHLPEVPVLFMSGYTEDAIQQHGELERDTYFIEKPFSPEGLSRRVREILDAEGD